MTQISETAISVETNKHLNWKHSSIKGMSFITKLMNEFLMSYAQFIVSDNSNRITFIKI